MQAKHFNQSGQFLETVEPDLSLNSQTERHLLKDFDILFAAKGSKNFAAQYESKNGLCVASSTFLVLRLKPEMQSNILPEYLCWFINHPKTQELIKSKARGSSIPSISKVELQELEILIPTLEKQIKIVKINTLQKTEQSIIKKIQILKDQYIQQILISAIIK